MRMNLLEAKQEALSRWGSYGTARTIRHFGPRGRFVVDYRVGILKHGHYRDLGRGANFEAAFKQYERAAAKARQVASAKAAADAEEQAGRNRRHVPNRPMRTHEFEKSLTEESKKLLADLMREVRPGSGNVRRVYAA